MPKSETLFMMKWREKLAQWDKEKIDSRLPIGAVFVETKGVNPADTLGYGQWKQKISNPIGYFWERVS